jgi:hypothetical protein
MMVTLRIRSVVWFATGAVLALVVSLLVLDALRADASPGDSDSTFVPITACRLIDTRPPPQRIGPFSTWGAKDTKTVQATGANGDRVLPTEAVGLSMNVTALNATMDGFLTFWPDGPLPLASSLNPSPGAPPIPNAVASSLSPTGSFKVYNENGTVDVIIDINGYYTQSSLKALASHTATIPSGVTITGYDGWDHAVIKDDADAGFFVQLPVRAPHLLTDDIVNFAPSSAAFDADATCTGTATAPTAPAGKVCIYISESANLDEAHGLGTFAPTTNGAFEVRFRSDHTVVGEDMYIWIVWAYTAP